MSLLLRVILKMRRTVLLTSFIPFGPNADIVTKDTKTVREAEISHSDTGWERLQAMFRKDEFGKLSMELRSIIQVACMSSFIGLLYGGITHSREAYIEFIKSNQATSFKSHLEAKKLLQDRFTVSFAKGGFKWCWRLTFFSTAYVTMSTCVAIYRGKNGILEHVIAGAFAGSTYKLKMGPRGWIVGGGLGMVLGTIGGFASYSLLSLSGMTMEEVRYWNYRWLEKRNEGFSEEIKKRREQEKTKLLRERELKLGNTKAVIDFGENEH